jgi:hypothetical protein
VHGPKLRGEQPEEKSIATLVRPHSPRAKYVAPTRSELATAERAFCDTLGGASIIDLRRAWSEIGFEIIEGGDLFVVRESTGQRRGRGFYAFRRGNSPLPLMLQAPHRYYDKHTGLITRQLFEESNFAAAAWNSISRQQTDFAHSDGYFNALTRAFVRQHADGIIVQLHGFARTSRKIVSAAQCDLILSNANRQPGIWVRETGRTLSSALVGFETRVYPLGVTDLGGTKNYQGRAARQSGSDGFLHVEMSAELRSELKSNAARRRAFEGGIEHGYGLRQRFQKQPNARP